MEAALTARMRRTSYEIFSSHFVFFVVKKNTVTWLYRRIPVGTSQDWGISPVSARTSAKHIYYVTKQGQFTVT